MEHILKLFKGKGYNKYKEGMFYIAATSQKQARAIILKVSGHNVCKNCLMLDYQPFWGEEMEHITPSGPCLYFKHPASSGFFKIYPFKKPLYKEVEIPFRKELSEMNIIEKIRFYYMCGKTRKEIINMGFNRNTVNRQIHLVKKCS